MAVDGAGSEMETTTTVALPTAAQAGLTCQTAGIALQKIGDEITSEPGSIDLATVGELITSAVAPAHQCQTAMEAAIPSLAAAAQGPAGDYARGLGAVIDLLQAPPTDADAVMPWLSQLSAAADPVAIAKSALTQADPSIGL